MVDVTLIAVIETTEDLKCSEGRGFMNFARKLLFVSVAKV